ncbi:MAG: sterol desaturase family protein [Bacteriovorax sp.]|jgi:sterol desaturase/sphingolipid hydroxylase (fatty acid hydroxylase superfamily)
MIFLGIILVLCFLFEQLFPLRQARDILYKRLLRNFSLALMAFPVTRLMTLPLVYNFAALMNDLGWGLLNNISAQDAFKNILGFIVLDYGTYWWHVANHKIKFFWRFHQVHHADKDMDSTTALRFHFGELVMSAFVRILLIFVFGLSPEILIIYDLLLTGFAIFHHSNLRLPVALDKTLSLLIVTPLYHQTHHSFFQSETDSNYAGIFSVWDKIHNSFSALLNPKAITIGLPSLEQSESSLLKLIKMPADKIQAWPIHLKNRP